MEYKIPTEELVRVANPEERVGTSVLSLGFDGFAWRVHPDGVLDEGRTGEQRFRDIVDDVINDRMIIVLEGFDSSPKQPTILNSMEEMVDFYRPGDESQFGSGADERSVWTDPMAGKVVHKPFRQIGVAGYTQVR